MLRPQKKQKPPPRSDDAGNSRHDYSRRRWEDLDADCLTNVFAKVGMESLLLALPFVCKSCKGKAVELKLPQFCTEEALRYAADGCPGSRYLHFTDDLVFFKHSQILPEVIGEWKLLEHLTLGGAHSSRDFEEKLLVLLDNVHPIRNRNLHEILVQVGIHCKRMRTLHVFDGCVGEDEALAIAAGLPNLVFLTLEQCRIEGNTIVTLLQGCKKLWRLDLWNFEGFAMDDDEMLKLGSRIKEFRWTRDMTILTRAKQGQIWRKRYNGLGIV
ncbi:hypothetical protein ACLB2K_064301 [Fragaria x ananassa]